jgi:hypothetical protein
MEAPKKSKTEKQAKKGRKTEFYEVKVMSLEKFLSMTTQRKKKKN